MTILQAALEFFTTKMLLFIQMITVDITTYNGGKIWKTIEIIYDAILSMGVTIAGVLIWFGLLSSTSRFVELKKASVWGQFLVELVLTNALLYYGKYVLLTVVNIGQGMGRKLMMTTGLLKEVTFPGMLGIEGQTTIVPDFSFETRVSDGLTNAVNGLSMSKGILLFIVVLVGAIFIAVSTIGVMLTIYGRLFHLYLMIAISPLPIAAAIGKPTRFVFFNFVKSFISVVLEALVIVLVLFLFLQFANTNDNLNQYEDYVSPVIYERAFGGVDESELAEYRQDPEVFRNTTRVYHFSDRIKNMLANNIPATVEEYNEQLARLKAMEENLGGTVFTYIAEMAFLFMMLFGMLKGTDKLVHRIFGL